MSVRLWLHGYLAMRVSIQSYVHVSIDLQQIISHYQSLHVRSNRAIPCCILHASTPLPGRFCLSC